MSAFQALWAGSNPVACTMKGDDVKRVVAYLGKSVTEFRLRVQNIADSFDIVLFPISEEHAAFYIEDLKVMTSMAHHLGLEVWTSPWGVCGIFGGEGLTTFAPGANVFQLVDGVRNWVDVAASTGCDAIHFDEPRGNVQDIVRDAVDYTTSFYNLGTHLYINTDLWAMPSIPIIASSIWGDMYNTSTPPKTDGVWIRGFRLTEDEVLTHVERYQIALNSDFAYVGIWAYDGCDQFRFLKSSPRFWYELLKERLI